MCGFLGCDARPFNPLLAALPRVLRASDRDGVAGGWLSRFMEVAEAESRTPRPGAEAVLARLSELMFVEIVRRHLESLPPDRTGWLAGLRDPHVGKALAALHARPGHPWTIDALGREAGLSRSALAERFTALVGEPPIQYLGRWRMQVAAGLLATTHDGHRGHRRAGRLCLRGRVQPRLQEGGGRSTGELAAAPSRSARVSLDRCDRGTVSSPDPE